MSRLFADEMTQAVDLSSKPRRNAALLLHAMSELDRDWALQRLSAAERSALAPLLSELQALGVAADLSHVRNLLGQPARHAGAPRAIIAAAPVGQVVQVLMHEPAALVHKLLALGPWPWAGEALGLLRARRGQAFGLVEPRAQVGESPALDHALLAAVAGRLSPSEGRQAPARQPVQPGWRRWWLTARRAIA